MKQATEPVIEDLGNLGLLLRFHEATCAYYRALRVRQTLLLPRLDRARLEALQALLTAILGRPADESELARFRL